MSKHNPPDKMSHPTTILDFIVAYMREAGIEKIDISVRDGEVRGGLELAAMHSPAIDAASPPKHVYVSSAGEAHNSVHVASSGFGPRVDVQIRCTRPATDEEKAADVARRATK